MTQFSNDNNFGSYDPAPSDIGQQSPSYGAPTTAPNQTKKPSHRGSLIAIICLSVFSVLLIALSIWLFINYTNEKNTVDAQVDSAVASATKKQADADEIKYENLQKLPYLQFVGPDDYGRVTFNYPRTWSQYIASDANNSTFKSYLNPVSVPAVSEKTQFALRVTIEGRSYETSVSSYDAKVKKGDLKSSVVTVDGVTGTRIEGSFSSDIRGAAVLFKIRDKTLTIRTDADTFLGDFNTLIQTIKFNQ